jgi:hypothetical protein
MLQTRRFLTRIAPMALALPLLLGSPEAASASSCTDDYLLCINEVLANGTDGPIDELGSIECGAEWAGCVLRKFSGA